MPASSRSQRASRWSSLEGRETVEALASQQAQRKKASKREGCSETAKGRSESGMTEVVALGVSGREGLFVWAGWGFAREDAEAQLLAALDGAAFVRAENPGRRELGRVDNELDCTASAFALASPTGRTLLLVARHASDDAALRALRSVHAALALTIASPFADARSGLSASPSFLARVNHALANL
jgi:hypothetical protein